MEKELLNRLMILVVVLILIAGIVLLILCLMGDKTLLPLALCASVTANLINVIRMQNFR